MPKTRDVEHLDTDQDQGLGVSVALIEVQDYSLNGWDDPNRGDERSRYYCENLEDGNILFFPQTPFPLAADARALLTQVRQTNSAHTKNISYRPKQDRVRGLAAGHDQRPRLREIMRAYSQNVARFVTDFLRPYAGGWQLDFASFRSVEERGRVLAPKARNDLLHVDAFPTRPTNGKRILRVFTNVNPDEPRIWLTAASFEALAERFASDAGLHQFAEGAHAWHHLLRQLASSMRTALGRPNHSRYDRFMLGFHDYLKANRAFQHGSKIRREFPPNSTWIVFTDMVSHAVLSGRFALEQTFILNRDHLMQPQKAPVEILERLCGTSLTH